MDLLRPLTSNRVRSGGRLMGASLVRYIDSGYGMDMCWYRPTSPAIAKAMVCGRGHARLCVA